MAAVNMGYGAVSQEGFVAFLDVLEKAPWAGVNARKLETENGQTEALVTEARVEARWKFRLTWALHLLLKASGGEALAPRVDAVWDRQQRRADSEITRLENDEDESVRADGASLRRQLLQGGGTAQTQLAHDKEVEFGRAQVRLARTPLIAATLKRHGLTATYERIAALTEELSDAIGLDQGASRRWVAVREATSECVASFNAVHGDMEWTLQHLPPGDVKTRVEALRDTLATLLDRHPTTAPDKRAKGAEPTDPPA